MGTPCKYARRMPSADGQPPINSHQLEAANRLATVDATMCNLDSSRLMRPVDPCRQYLADSS